MDFYKNSTSPYQGDIVQALFKVKRSKKELLHYVTLIYCMLLTLNFALRGKFTEEYSNFSVLPSDV